MNTITQNVGSIVEQMLAGHLDEEEIIDALTSLEDHRFTGTELAQAATIMRKAAVPMTLEGCPMDTCGTGGSGLARINTSTLVAFVVAAAGGTVAKHGNRSSGGRCGSFDVLEGLGAHINLTADQAKRIYDRLGIVFLFAPQFHPAMRNVAAARKRYGKRTIFNLLGPLCHPAGVKRQLIGTPNGETAALIAEALQELHTERSMVVSGKDGLDEVTVCGETEVYDSASEKKNIFAHAFHPENFGIPLYAPSSITGGDVQTNVDIAKDILSNASSPAHRDLVIVNAAHALLLTDLVTDLPAAISLARETLSSGKAQRLMERYIAITHTIS